MSPLPMGPPVLFLLLAHPLDVLATHTCQMCVCVLDVHLLIIQFCRAVDEWCRYFEFRQQLSRILLTSDYTHAHISKKLIIVHCWSSALNADIGVAGVCRNIH